MARRKKTNKNLVIILLVVLLLALAVGYAAFSETLTITGTANAKGTFDLEFQNADVVTAIGVNAENTKAVISPDKNTLTVTVADLAYPGSGVEFTTDIANVGSIPATVEAVTIFDLDGSDNLKKAIKIKGLDAITTDHPTLASGDRCNIHFTVEWDKDSQIELGEADGTLKFGLAIQYTQKTDETFTGKPSHSDGNTVTTDPVTPPVEKQDPVYTPPTEVTAYVGQKLSDVELPSGFTWKDDITLLETEGTHTFKAIYTPEDTTNYNTVELDVEIEVIIPTLVQAIKGEDYGKSINYSVTVGSKNYNEWMVLYNDGTNVQIIMNDWLPQSEIPQAAYNAGLQKVTSEGRTTYCVNAASANRDTLINVLTNTNNWSVFATGISGSTAVGGVTKEVMESSFQQKYGKEWENTTAYNDLLFVPHPASSPTSTAYQGCDGAWLTTPHATDENGVWGLGTYGSMTYASYTNTWRGIRPVVILPANTKGIVGDTVTIQK